MNSLLLKTIKIFLILVSLNWNNPTTAEEPKPDEPTPTVELRVTVNGKVITIDDPYTLKLGESAQLKVEAVRPDGTVTDVTSDSKTFYSSITPWNLSVTQTGLVSATPDPRFPARTVESDIGTIIVNYGATDDKDIGVASIFFEIIQEPKGEEGALYVKASKTTLRVGETVQLKVIQKLPDGSTRDLTDASTGTTYFSTDEFMLVPEPDGRVACVGTRGKPEESANIGVKNDEFYDSIRFKLLLNGPGPGLEIVAENPVIHEGEQTRLHVYESLPDGSRQDVTATSTGTRYLTFTGYKPLDLSLFRINDTGLASASDSIAESIGRYNRLRVVVFVRNGDSVGWIELEVLRANAR